MPGNVIIVLKENANIEIAGTRSESKVTDKFASTLFHGLLETNASWL